MEAKDKILKATEELIYRFGIKRITMDDIAKQLGMSKKTIYQFYANKEEVVHQLMLNMLVENQRVFTCIKNDSENIVDEFFQCMNQMQHIFSNKNPLLFYDLQKYYTDTWQIFLKFKEDFILKMVKESLVKGIEQGFVRKDINVNIVARLRIAEVDLGFNPLSFPPDQFAVTEVQVAMLEHFLYGICTLKGLKLIEKYKSNTH